MLGKDKESDESSEDATLGTPDLPETSPTCKFEEDDGNINAKTVFDTDPNIENPEMKKQSTDYVPFGLTPQKSTQDIFSSTKTTIIHEDKENTATPPATDDMDGVARFKSAQSMHSSSGGSVHLFDTPSQPSMVHVLSSNRGWGDADKPDAELDSMMEEMSQLDTRLSTTEYEEEPTERRRASLFNAETVQDATEEDLDDGTRELEEQIQILRKITEPPQGM